MWSYVSVGSLCLCVCLQPPIAVFGVDGRYAHALYSAASKEKRLEAVEQDLVTLSVRLVMELFLLISVQFLNQNVTGFLRLFCL